MSRVNSFKSFYIFNYTKCFMCNNKYFILHLYKILHANKELVSSHIRLKKYKTCTESNWSEMELFGAISRARQIKNQLYNVIK